MRLITPLDLDRTVSEIKRLATVYTADVAGLGWHSIHDVFEGVKRIPYRKDETAPECVGSIECVKRPGLTLALGGDCDDKVVVAGAALNLLGVPWRIVTASYADDGVMTHVYLEVLIGGRWFPFDPTSPDTVLGEEIPARSKAIW